MEAITRSDKFLAAIAGMDVELPEPITRSDKFLKAIADKVGNAGGGGVGVTTFYWDDGTYFFSDPERTKKVSKAEYLSAMTGLILIDYYGETYLPVVTMAYDDCPYVAIRIVTSSNVSSGLLTLYTSEYQEDEGE